MSLSQKRPLESRYRTKYLYFHWAWFTGCFQVSRGQEPTCWKFAQPKPCIEIEYFIPGGKKVAALYLACGQGQLSSHTRTRAVPGEQKTLTTFIQHATAKERYSSNGRATGQGYNGPSTYGETDEGSLGFDSSRTLIVRSSEKSRWAGQRKTESFACIVSL